MTKNNKGRGYVQLVADSGKTLQNKVDFTCNTVVVCKSSEVEDYEEKEL